MDELILALYILGIHAILAVRFATLLVGHSPAVAGLDRLNLIITVYRRLQIEMAYLQKISFRENAKIL